MCLAQGQNAVTPVRLETAALWSRVKHSTTELPFAVGLKNSCLFVCLFDSLGPINNLSVIKGQVFLGLTSTKLG